MSFEFLTLENIKFYRYLFFSVTHERLDERLSKKRICVICSSIQTPTIGLHNWPVPIRKEENFDSEIPSPDSFDLTTVITGSHEQNLSQIRESKLCLLWIYFLFPHTPNHENCLPSPCESSIGWHKFLREN